MLQVIAPQHRDLPVFFLLRSSWLEGSGRLSLGTRCITVVFPAGSPSADSVTFPWRNRPWYINRRISALETWKANVVCVGQVNQILPTHPPTLAASYQRRTVRYHQHFHSDWTDTPWSSRWPESIVNLSKTQIIVKDIRLTGNKTYFVLRNIFGAQNRHLCKFMLSRLSTAWLCLEYYSNLCEEFYLLVEAVGAVSHESKNSLRHG